MAVTVRMVDGYYTDVEDHHGKGYWLLEHIRQQGVNLIAFSAHPIGSGKSQLHFIVEDTEQLQKAMRQAGSELQGPKRAFLVQGQDEVGAIVDLHAKLAQAEINAHAANGVSAGNGSFGYVLWVEPDDYERAATALGAVR